MLSSYKSSTNLSFQTLCSVPTSLQPIYPSRHCAQFQQVFNQSILPDIVLSSYKSSTNLSFQTLCSVPTSLRPIYPSRHCAQFLQVFNQSIRALIFTEKTRKDPRIPEKTRKDPKRPEKIRKDPKRRTYLYREDPKRRTYLDREDPKRRTYLYREDPKRYPKRPKKTRKDIFIVNVSEWKMTRVMLIVFEH